MNVNPDKKTEVGQLSFENTCILLNVIIIFESQFEQNLNMTI